MKTTRFIIFLTILASNCLLSVSQDTNKSVFSFKGSVIDEANGDSIPFVNIFNESTRRWAIADESGKYSLSVCTGDTLVFTAIGFLGKVILVNDNLQDKENTIYLTSQSYKIEEVKVLGYRNYDDFKKAFIELELPENKIDRIKEELNIEGTAIAIKADYERRAEEALSQQGIGFTFSPGRPLNEEKIRREKLQQEAAMQRAVDKKYNREIVFELTKLPEDELTNFMGFCNFSLEYLYNTSDYDILVKIMEKFNLYKVSIDTCG